MIDKISLEKEGLKEKRKENEGTEEGFISFPLGSVSKLNSRRDYSVSREPI
jgi:hypothetical protein